MRNSLFVGAFALMLSSGSAFADCNYNSSDAVRNCQGAISDWFDKTKDNQSQSSEDIQKRVDTLKDVLNECISCGMDKIEEGSRTASSADSDSSASDSDESDDDSASDPE